MMATARGVNTREECHWAHACKSFKRTCVGSNGILECKFLSENAHRDLVWGGWMLAPASTKSDRPSVQGSLASPSCPGWLESSPRASPAGRDPIHCHGPIHGKGMTQFMVNPSDKKRPRGMVLDHTHAGFNRSRPAIQQHVCWLQPQ
jgi:hypothetical protein